MSEPVLYVKPAVPGAIVRDPVTFRPLPPEGEAKPRTVHWLRMIARADVVETTAEEIAAAVNASKPKRQAKE